MTRYVGMALVLFASACATPKPKPPPPPPVNPAEAKLAHYRDLEAQLRQAQARFLPALEAFQQARVDYQKAVPPQMIAARANSRAVRQITAMAGDASRISQALLQAYRQATEAYPVRAEAGERVLSVEVKLWDLEVRAFGSRADALAKVGPDAEKLRGVLAELSGAQQEQYDAVAALTAKEGEVWATIGDDPKARDRADQELADARSALDRASAKVVEMSIRFDMAVDQVHQKLLAAMPAKPELTGAIRALLGERSQLVADLVRARTQIKEATLSRAEHRAQEIAYDGEFNLVLRGAFRNEAQRSAFLGRVRSQREQMIAARRASMSEEESLNDVRKQLTTVEGEILALFY